MLNERTFIKMKTAYNADEIVWKRSPIKTDIGILHKVHIGEKQEEKQPTLLQKLGYKKDMTREEFSKFLETATTLFDDDESPIKAKPKDPKIAQQTQSQFDMLFASPNESFQAVPYTYEEEEEVAPGDVNILDESMRDETPVGELSTHLTEEDVDYMNIIRRITNSNKVNNGIPHPFAPVDVSTHEEYDDCRTMTLPSLQQYSFQDPVAPDINVASSIESNTSYVREIRAKTNPLASSHDFDANNISFGGNNELMQTLAQFSNNNVADSMESLDIQAIIARNRAAINRSKGMVVVSEAQKYLDDHSPVKTRPQVNSSSGISVNSVGGSTGHSHQTVGDVKRQELLNESHRELLTAMDDGLTQHWNTLQSMHAEIDKHRAKGTTVSHYEGSLQAHLDHLMMMSPEALQTIVFTQVGCITL